MANRNFNGVQINQGATIAEKAGADIEDCRNRAMAYDEDGNVVPASGGTKPIVGVAMVEAGWTDMWTSRLRTSAISSPEGRLQRAPR